MKRNSKKTIGGKKSQSRKSRPALKNEPSPEEASWAYPSRRLLPAFLSAILLWMSFPPVGLSVLAWVAPMGWLYVIEDRRELKKRDYFHLWLTGCVFWLATLQGIRLAFWPLYFGWLAISLYLAVYTPLFVGWARGLRHSGFPLWVAAPVAWVALEFTRSYMLTGYCANMLGHTQALNSVVIQIADQVGVYGISWTMLAVCATVFELGRFFLDRRKSVSSALSTESPPEENAVEGAAEPTAASAGRFPAWALGFATISLGTTLGYGIFRLRQADELYRTREPLLSCLLVQENTPTMFDSTQEDLVEAWKRYRTLTVQTLSELQKSKEGKVDLVVWPESTFTAGEPWFEPTLPNELPADFAGADRTFVKNRVAAFAENFRIKSRLALGLSPGEQATDSTPLLLAGGDTIRITEGGQQHFNSAFLIDEQGEPIERYDKMHLVMFGEYIPLGSLLGWLRAIFPLSAVPGDGPKSFEVAGTQVSPNICFESMMPRVIQSQIATLTSAGESPEVLVNISNDSWFRGSAILDHHLACTILCAVENRRPILTAANTGLSAEVDGCGRVVQVTQRFAAETLLASPKTDGRGGVVQSLGYPLAWISFSLALIFNCIGWFRSKKALS